MNEELPLVSVPVITYNSSKYILETLESIKAQTYQNIELIVSDDCSTDNTVEICREWIKKNKDRFVRTELLTSTVNTGISANGNRAEAACEGEWVKSIAGDDLLMPKCIEVFIKYVSINPDIVYVFAKVSAIGSDKNYCNYIENAYSERSDRMSIMTTDEIREELYKGNTPPAPASFYNRTKIIELNIHNDERIRNIEDWARWIDLVNKGVKFAFINQKLVKYRVGSGISTTSNWQSLSSFKAKRQTYFYYIFESLYANNPHATLESIIDFECDQYNRYLEQKQKVDIVKEHKFISFLFRIFKPFLS